MKFEMNMSKEKNFDNDRMLFPEGVQKVKILSCEVKTSKAGNDYLWATIMCMSTSDVSGFAFSMKEGKRWALKSLLTATEKFYKNSGGDYVFDTDELAGQVALAHVVNVEEEYTDKNLNKRAIMKSVIKKFLPAV